MDLSNLTGGDMGRGQMGGPGQPGPTQRVNLNINDLTDIDCDECGNKTFQQAMLLKKVSALVSPSGQAGLVPIQVFACTMCGHVNEQFMPEAPPEQG